MDTTLGTILRNNLDYYVSNLYTEELITPMVQCGILSNDEMLEFLENNNGSQHKTLLVIGFIIKRASVEQFIKILRFKGVHSFVADEFELHKINTMANGISYANTPRVSTKTDRLVKVKKYALGLKKLIHSGYVEDFNLAAKLAHDNWNRLWSCPSADLANAIQESADLLFYTLDAQLGELRVRSDPDMCKREYFDLMEKVIKYTSEPHVSSMMYLARYGSAIAHRETLDIGMTQIAVAIEHSESVHPCKETGMVYYIEINMLFRKYHTQNDISIKRELLNKTALAISHFEMEDPMIKEEYTRMLLLKQVYVYLGLGVHGEEIANRFEEPGDLESARKCLVKIKETEWLLDKRRLMFLYIAEAILNERCGNLDRALRSAIIARDMATEGTFKTELASIGLHILRLTRGNEINKNRLRNEALQCLNELLPGFSGITGK